MKNKTLTKIDIDTYTKVKQLTNELSAIQKQRIPIHETLRRTFNVPNLDMVLKQDAIGKRFKK